MSDNDRNDERPTGPAEPTSGADHQGGVADTTDAARGWRPSDERPALRRHRRAERGRAGRTATGADG